MPKLVETLLVPLKRPVLRLVLSDEGIVRRLLEQSLQALNQGTPGFFGGKGAIALFVTAASEGSLFAAPPPAIVELDPKLTAKQWEGEQKILGRLPRPPDTYGFFIGPTASRNLHKDSSMFQEAWLCYSPNEIEAQRAALQLVKRYPALAKRSAADLEAIAGKAVEYYSSDLLMCDMHFERMAQSGVEFDAALSCQTEARAVHVVDALAQGSADLVELRLQQCLMSGEDIGYILKSISGFLRQLTQVQRALERSPDLDGAFRSLEIRQPLLQNRIRRALKTLPVERVAAFFFAAAELEMTLRTQKNPHEWLAVELVSLLKPS
jgi:hypothetical protein